ncbi:MAG: hypothetical protein L0211_22380 [Planctomycetaceae bacterium]|nr:hypothetical protein [Planctomycetaceae bacterium]
MSVAHSLAPSSRLAAVAAGLSLLVCCEGLAAAEPVEWSANHAEAVARARKHGKLLLVVHLSGDFAANAADAPEAKLYRELILSDPRVVAALADRFVVTYKHVGEARALRRQNVALPADRKDSRAEAAKGPPRPSEMAIAYICLPDERVLHFVPGFVSARQLHAELAWVEACYSQLVNLSEAEMRGELRTLHQAEIEPPDHKAFLTSFQSRWPASGPAPEYSTVEIPFVINSARLVWRWSQGQRLGMNTAFDKLSASARFESRSTLSSSLAAHGRLGTDFAHLVMSEFPLAYLSDLAEPAYEACAGQRFWQVSPRRDELARWWADCAKRGRRTMLIVSGHVQPDDANPAAEVPPASPPPWPDDDAARLAELWRVAAQVVTIDELALVLTDANLPPLEYDSVAGPPRLILHDARGFRCGEVAASDVTAEKLAGMLRTVVGAAASERAIQPTGEQASSVKE